MRGTEQRELTKYAAVRINPCTPDGWRLADCGAALDLWCQGYSKPEIADAYGCFEWDIDPLSSRFKWPRRFDLRRAAPGRKMRHWHHVERPAGWSQADLDRARAMWDAGKSQSAIGNEFGKSKHVINGLAHRLGWPGRASPVIRRAPTAQPPVKPKPNNRPPLPAGHPLTWGAISHDPYPGG